MRRREPKEPRKTRQEIQEEEDAKELQEFLSKYHLDSINEKDFESIKEISGDLLHEGLVKGIGFMAMPVFESAKLRYLSAMVKQNFIIIRKLDELIKEIENRK